MNAVFVDAGAWIAVTNRRDAHHPTAAAIYQRLLRDSVPLITSNLVVAEAYIAIRRAIGHAPAIGLLRALRASSRLRRIYADAELESEAESLLIRYADQDFSLADATSFALMRRLEITDAFAFDRHFRTAGFALLTEPGALP